MPRQTSTFALGYALHRRTVFVGNGTRHPESPFLDFVLDGEPLTARIPEWGDSVTPLNRAWLPAVPRAIDELLGRRPSPGLAASRVALLVCGECGDLGCGAMTAALQVEANSVSWADFLGENGYSEPWPVEGAPEAVTFSRGEYEATLRGAYERLAALPSAHRRRSR